jgi:hypothetical protein
VRRFGLFGTFVNTERAQPGQGFVGSFNRPTASSTYGNRVDLKRRFARVFDFDDGTGQGVILNKRGVGGVENQDGAVALCEGDQFPRLLARRDRSGG